MNLTLSERAALMVRLGEYLTSGDPGLAAAKELACHRNGWFIPRFVDYALEQIASRYLEAGRLEAWLAQYPGLGASKRTVGIVMAGNIPAVGFHDLLCGLVSGHTLRLKLSGKDEVLMGHMLEVLKRWEPRLEPELLAEERLKGCDAYIATGSNNTARYFQQYFGRYPHIIRSNRTSVAVLDGTETAGELGALADDMLLYFGLGCRNVTQIYVPEGYDFLPLLEATKNYRFLMDDHHYRNNFDYNLSIALLNKEAYMTNEVVMLLERPEFFSRIGVVHYAFYPAGSPPVTSLGGHPDIQCVVGHGALPFGSAQQPALDSYADGVDTLRFLETL